MCEPDGGETSHCESAWNKSSETVREKGETQTQKRDVYPHQKTLIETEVTRAVIPSSGEGLGDGGAVAETTQSVTRMAAEMLRRGRTRLS